MFLTVLWKNFRQKAGLFSSFLALFFLAFYKAFLSGFFASGGACRFYPSCGEYAFLVYKKHSFLKASAFLLKRLLACRPFGPKFRPEPEIEEKHER